MNWGFVTSASEPGVTAAQELADLFDAGGFPPPMVAPMRMERDEVCYGQAPVAMQMFAEGDGSYLHKTRFGLSAMGLAMGAATVVGNQARKARAAREAAAQWRPCGQGVVYITDRRLTIREQQEWNNVWYRDVMTSTCDGSAIEIQRTGLPGLRLTLPQVHYYFVLFYRFAFDQVTRPPAAF